VRDVQRRAPEKGGGTAKDMQLKKDNPSLAAAPALSSPLLPMFKPKLTAKAAHAVGNYALQIDFNDGARDGNLQFRFLENHLPLPGMCPRISE